MMEDLTGKQPGPYRVVAALGEGGMAVVYKAYQPCIDRYLEIKVLARQLALYPEFVGRFRHEAKPIARLLHPHILPAKIVAPNASALTLSKGRAGPAPSDLMAAAASSLPTTLTAAGCRAGSRWEGPTPR